MFNFINESAVRENQRTSKMELAKIIAFFTGFINVFLYLAAWFANLDNVKSTILFIVALVMTMRRFWRWEINSRQNKQLKDIEIEKKRLENEEFRLRLAKGSIRNAK